MRKVQKAYTDDTDEIIVTDLHIAIVIVVFLAPFVIPRIKLSSIGCLQTKDSEAETVAVQVNRQETVLLRAYCKALSLKAKGRFFEIIGFLCCILPMHLFHFLLSTNKSQSVIISQINKTAPAFCFLCYFRSNICSFPLQLI